jgi:hypothetical protein
LSWLLYRNQLIAVCAVRDTLRAGRAAVTSYLLGHLTQVLVAWGPLGILLLSILDSAGIPVVFARIIRYFGEVWLGIELGHQSSSFLKTHVWQLTASAVALFAVLYGLMLWRHRATNSVPSR